MAWRARSARDPIERAQARRALRVAPDAVDRDVVEPAQPQRVVIALDDPLLALMPAPRSFDADGHRVVYVPASSFEDPAREADLWIGRYAPSAPGREFFFQTASGAVYERDEYSTVWRNGVRVTNEPLVDYGVPETRQRGLLRTGRPAALLFLLRERDGWRARLRVTTPVLLIGRLPGRPRERAVPPAWLSLAGRLSSMA